MGQGTEMGTPVHPQKRPSEGLTSIHTRIHCATTPDATEGRYSETDRIIIENFLNTLAEVALAVASRKERQDEQ